MSRANPPSFQARALTREAAFLATITPGAEAFAVLARDYPLSAYRLFLRASPTGKWWRFDGSCGAPSRYDPIRHQMRIDVYGRTVCMWGHARDMLLLGHHPDKPALVRAMARIRDVCGVVSP